MVLTYELCICRIRHWELNNKNRLDGKACHSNQLSDPHYPQSTTATSIHIFILDQCFASLTGNDAKDPSSHCRDGAFHLRTVIILTNSETALLAHAVSPEALDGDGASKVSAETTVMILADLLRHSIVSEQEPEAKDGLR